MAAKDRVREFVLAKTENLVRLTEKASALGGRPVAEVGTVACPPSSRRPARNPGAAIGA